MAVKALQDESTQVLKMTDYNFDKFADVHAFNIE